jgi:hypothetical protein
MKDDLDLGVGEHRAEAAEVGHLERVHDQRALARGQLQQVDPVAVAVKAGRLGVHGQLTTRGKLGQEAIEALLLLHEEHVFADGVAHRSNLVRMRAKCNLLRIIILGGLAQSFSLGTTSVSPR